MRYTLVHLLIYLDIIPNSKRRIRNVECLNCEKRIWRRLLSVVCLLKIQFALSGLTRSS